MTSTISQGRACHSRFEVSSRPFFWPCWLALFGLAGWISAAEPLALILRSQGQGTNATLRLTPVNHPTNEIITIETTANLVDWTIHYWLQPGETSAVFPQSGSHFFRARRPEPVHFATSPPSLAVEIGGGRVLRAQAEGYPILGYSWHKAATPEEAIATGQEIGLGNAQPEQSGAYVAATQTLGIVNGNVTIVAVYSHPFYLQIGPPGLAPIEFPSRVMMVGVTRGTGALAASGSYQLATAADGGSYVIVPVIGTRPASDGKLVYYCKFGPNKARMVWEDRLHGTAQVDLDFISERAGSIVVVTETGREEGNFILE
jgi:hypothetical protein